MILAAQHLPLAANLGDFIEFGIFLLVMIMGAAGHLLNSKAKPKPPVRPRPVNPPANPAAAGGPGGQPMTLEETLRKEVEEFMRRAQGREPAAPTVRAPQGPPRRPAPQRKPSVAAKTAPPQRTAPVRRLTDAPDAQTSARPPEPVRTAPLGAGVGQHVAQHLSGTQAMAAHAQHLGADVAQADERMVSHLQEKFTHQLGALQHQDSAQQRKALRSPAAQALIDLMKQPGGAKQVVLASEILRRPEERWQRSET
jgi:hypothetical protein